MDLETGHPICSLCRRELSNLSFDAGLEAKLCEVCRDLIQTACHGSQAHAAAASAGAQHSAAVPSVQSGVSPVSGMEADSPAFFDDLPAFDGTSEQAHQTDFFNFDDRSFEMDDADEQAAKLELDPRSFNAPVLELTEHHEEAFVEPIPSSENIHPEPGSELGTDLSELHQSLFEDRDTSGPPLNVHMNVPAPALDKPLDKSIEQSSNKHEDAQSNAAAAIVDPWEDPLPAWDYSKNEWPVLMGPPRERSFAKYKIPFAVIMILAFGAGFYYFVYPQISRDQPSPNDSLQLARASETPASAKTAADSAAPSQAQATASNAPVTAEVKPTQPENREAGVASDTGNAQGHLALQAAAFPTREGADEFAEKLKTAGVPSYVVSADLARRGRWFRVRVGRFNTADDAQKFAAEAQRRAKAAGMSLQLMVSQYDQP